MSFLATEPVENETIETGDKKRGTILIVEDNNEIRHYLSSGLAELFNTLEAGNGEEALEKLKENEVDIIVTDVMMPVMDGLAATEAIRAAAREDAKTIPILAMTANAFQEDQEQCYKAGMNAHLAKPLNMEKVIRTIYEQCSYKLSGRQQNKKT